MHCTGYAACHSWSVGIHSNVIPGPLTNPGRAVSDAHNKNLKKESATYDGFCWDNLAKRLKPKRTAKKERKGAFQPESAGAIMAARVLMRHAPHPQLVREIPDQMKKERQRQKTLQWLSKRRKRKLEDRRVSQEEHDASRRAMAVDTQAVCELCGRWLPPNERVPHHPNFGSGFLCMGLVCVKVLTCNVIYICVFFFFLLFLKLLKYTVRTKEQKQL